MKYWILAGLLLCSCASAPEGDSKRSTGELWVVGSDLDNYPFAAVDASGEPLGRDVEMMHQLATRNGAELEWRRMPFDQLLGSVAAGEVDLVCATMGITEERARSVAFSDPYFETEIAVVVRTGFGVGPTLAERLVGRPVHAGRGTTSEVAVRESLPKSIAVLETKGEGSSADMLLSGEVDALVMDGPAAAAVVADSAGAFELAPSALASEKYGLVLARNRGDGLVQQLNASLRALRENGQLAELDFRFELAPQN